MPTDENQLSSRRAAEADVTDAASGFWLAHMRIGFATFLAESLAVLGYLALTPDGPHRRLLLAVVILWIASAILGLAIAPVVCRRSWRTTYSICWTLASSIAVACVAVLDGGSSSPILLLLFLPLIYAALMFTPLAAAACGVGALASYAVVVLAEHSGGSDRDRSVVFLAVLLGGSVLSVAASINRTHMERHERDLRAIITELATFDELTGCLVRRVFHERVEAEIDRAERYDLPLALVMIDIDGFKVINDTYGHVVGDSVLSRVGEVLRREHADDRSGRTIGRRRVRSAVAEHGSTRGVPSRRANAQRAVACYGSSTDGERRGRCAEQSAGHLIRAALRRCRPRAVLGEARRAQRGRDS